MTIQEILEAHLGSEWIEWKHSQCQCGHKFEGEYNSTTRRAHVAEVLEKHMQEREAKAWDKGVATALNHAILNPDGLTLRLEHLDGRPWINPYADEEPSNGR